MYDKSILVTADSGNAMSPIVISVASQQHHQWNNLQVILSLKDPFLDERAWYDLLERIQDALQNYIRTKELFLTRGKKIVLTASIANFGYRSEVIWQ